VTIQTQKLGTGSLRNMTLGNGTSDISISSAGNINFNNAIRLTTAGASISIYKSVTTAGWGVPSIYGSGRATAQTAANASVATYTCGSADGSFLISANVLITTLGSGNFTCTVAYTDEGNTARTTTLTFQNTAGTVATACAAAGPFQGNTIRIRVKASTAITIATTGTFTGCTYNVEGSILQIS
jgi:hypothetical protein